MLTRCVVCSQLNFLSTLTSRVRKYVFTLRSNRQKMMLTFWSTESVHTESIYESAITYDYIAITYDKHQLSVMWICLYNARGVSVNVKLHLLFIAKNTNYFLNILHLLSLSLVRSDFELKNPIANQHWRKGEISIMCVLYIQTTYYEAKLIDYGTILATI